jgi:PIN domain nuclease of toxin-antitoxin system
VVALDTHALVWWVSDPKRIPVKARRLIDAAIRASEPLIVSSISLWEIAMLVAHGRLELTFDTARWITHVEALPFLSFHAVDNSIARRAVDLEGFPHRDPADRMIVATALVTNATLVTADKRLRSYRPLSTAWD